MPRIKEGWDETEAANEALCRWAKLLRQAIMVRAIYKCGGDID